MHDQRIDSLKFSPDGQRLYSASYDDWVRVWDLQCELVDEFAPGGGEAQANTINAPPSLVWERLVQVGYRPCGRAGWYTDSWVNDLVDGFFLNFTAPPKTPRASWC